MNKKLLLPRFARLGCIQLGCIQSNHFKQGRAQLSVVTTGRAQMAQVRRGRGQSSWARFLAAFLLASLSTIGSADTEFSVENYKGKIVYVDFWASWCIPCRASFPFMQEMSEKYGDSLVIAAINVDESRADADQFLEEFTVNFDIVYDPKGALAESFDVKGMPTSYLFDREGNLLGSHLGFREKDMTTLEETIANAINTAAEDR